MSSFAGEIDAALNTLKYPDTQHIIHQQDDIDQVSAENVIQWLCKKLPDCHQPLFDSHNFDKEICQVLNHLKSPLPATSSRVAIVHTIIGEVLAKQILDKSKRLSSKNVASLVHQVVHNHDIQVSNVTSASKLIEEITSQAVNQVDKEESLFPSAGLSQDDWQHLENIRQELQNDLKMRGETMIHRCETTLQAFASKNGLSKECRSKLNEIAKLIKPKIESQIKITFADCICIRCNEEGRLLNSVVSSEKHECKIKDPSGRDEETELHRYVIPQVPDRGGRVEEQRPARNETFGEQYSDARRGRGGRGGGGGGDRGHRKSGGRGGGGGSFHHRGGRAPYNRGHQGGGHRAGGNRNYDD